jgi:hypothetical protein
MHTQLNEEPQAAVADHETVRVFSEHGWRLNAILTLMLNEHFSHRTERRGCGFTQSSRHVAEFINRPRDPLDRDELRLFADRGAGLSAFAAMAADFGLELRWRTIDRDPPPSELARSPEAMRLWRSRAQQLAELRALTLLPLKEESLLLTRLIVGCVLPDQSEDLPALPSWPDRLEIGTCPLAERYFLEVAGAFVRRSGAVNVIIAAAGQPLLIEKVGLGDDHSCISLVPLRLNDVTIPPGSLLGVKYLDDPSVRPNKDLPGRVIPLAHCQGFRFLRLTTLSVSPQNRARAFTAHFEAQMAGGLFAPGETTIANILEAAWRQL